MTPFFPFLYAVKLKKLAGIVGFRVSNVEPHGLVSGVKSWKILNPYLKFECAVFPLN